MRYKRLFKKKVLEINLQLNVWNLPLGFAIVGNYIQVGIGPFLIEFRNIYDFEKNRKKIEEDKKCESYLNFRGIRWN